MSDCGAIRPEKGDRRAQSKGFAAESKLRAVERMQRATGDCAGLLGEGADGGGSGRGRALGIQHVSVAQRGASGSLRTGSPEASAALETEYPEAGWASLPVLRDDGGADDRGSRGSEDDEGKGYVGESGVRVRPVQ